MALVGGERDVTGKLDSSEEEGQIVDEEEEGMNGVENHR